MTADLVLEKKALRQKILAKRRGLMEEKIFVESVKIADRLDGFSPYNEAACIMCYAAMQDEVQTAAIMRKAFSEGKKICVPYIKDRTASMAAAYIKQLTDLKIGSFGILTPDEASLCFAAPAEIDLVLLPGVAFSKSGDRLGMGVGYYDRFLESVPQAILAALSLECQIVDRVPCEPHDKKVNAVITASGIIDCKTGKMQC